MNETDDILARLREVEGQMHDSPSLWGDAANEIARLRDVVQGYETSDPFEAGVRSVLFIRCMKHRAVPQYNTNEASGAECPTCEVERLQGRTRLEFQHACAEADRQMKATNGHRYITILKTRCEWCGRSPRQSGRCAKWLETFLSCLFTEINETSRTGATG